jgi:polyphosphate glucokinase
MASPLNSSPENILAIDIGATSIKYGMVDSKGQLVESVRRVATPYPCTPHTLVEIAAMEIAASGCSRVGIGFPGELSDGLVIEPGNLSRPGGVSTEVDKSLDEEWRQFDFQQAMRDACPQEIRIVNDATLAALGCCDGVGRELVFTLGTGFGIALVIEGAPRRIRDVGAEEFCDGLTYDQALGETSRSRDQFGWVQLLRRAVDEFVEEFAPDTLHVGGGNARLVDHSLFGNLNCRVVFHDNDVTLRGVAKLFERAESAPM